MRNIQVLNCRGKADGTVTPISVATGKPGKPIPVGVNPVSMLNVTPSAFQRSAGQLAEASR